MRLTRCTGRFTSGGSLQLFVCWNVIINYMYFFTRYVSQKKFSELEGMLFDGALLLFSHQETASGVIKAFIDVISRSEGQYFENDSLLGGSCQTVC